MRKHSRPSCHAPRRQAAEDVICSRRHHWRKRRSCAMEVRLFASEHGLEQSEILSRWPKPAAVARVRETSGRPLHRGEAHRHARTRSRRPSGRTPVALLAPDDRRREDSRSRQGDRDWRCRYRPLCQGRRPLAGPGGAGECAADVPRRVSRQAPPPFQAQHPGCASSWSEARQVSLSKGEADLAIRAARPHEKGVVARRLAAVTFGLYGSRRLSRQVRRG